jgi:MerR family transcriptional regulator, thiopeptide resistance regulator
VTGTLESMTNDGVAPDGLTVGATASAVGVTVRTLHHWDAMGLVRPSGRTVGGYRLYSAADIARVHRVLVYRELGLPLADIGVLLDTPATDAAVPLRNQRAQLVERISRLRRMVDAVDRMIEATNSGILLSAEEQISIFGKSWQPERVADARDRWGDTVQWAQYAERTAGMTAEDWRQVAKNTSALDGDLAAAKRAGVGPGSAEGNALAERHRASIGVYFHCTHSMQVCLGRKYVAEPGFTAHYDAMGPGLTWWLRDLIDANARAQGVDPETATWT